MKKFINQVQRHPSYLYDAFCYICFAVFCLLLTEVTIYFKGLVCIFAAALLILHFLNMVKDELNVLILLIAMSVISQSLYIFEYPEVLKSSYIWISFFILLLGIKQCLLLYELEKERRLF